MPRNYYRDDALAVCLITAAIVFALAWLFNAYKLGKFKKAAHTAPTDSIAQTPHRKGLLLLISLAVLLTLTLLAMLPSILSTSKVSDVPAIMVEDTLYFSTSTPVSSPVSEADILGRTTSYTEELPRKNGQSNLLAPDSEGLPYASCEGGLAVLVDGAWIFFKAG